MIYKSGETSTLFMLGQGAMRQKLNKINMDINCLWYGQCSY